MQYTLNGKDVLTIFGVTVNNGAETLLTFPKRKESVNTNWPEQDGIDIDLTDPHFEAREFKLSCTLIGTSRSDFKTKFFGLFAELKKQYIQELYSDDIAQTYYLYYKEMQNMRKLSPRVNSSQVGVAFDLILGEVDPATNIPAVYLVDESNNFLVA